MDVHTDSLTLGVMPAATRVGYEASGARPDPAVLEGGSP